MTEDEKAQFIADQITQAAREVNPSAQPFPSDELDLKVIKFGLNVFDRLMPMVVALVREEVNKQAAECK